MAEVSRMLANHPFYRNIKLDGARWKIFQRSLLEMGRMESRFVFFQSPACRLWRSYIAGSFIDRAEITYAKMLRGEILKYHNMCYVGFDSAKNNLSDKMFYDSGHLNRAGAEVFSEILAAKILEVSAAK